MPGVKRPKCKWPCPERGPEYERGAAAAKAFLERAGKADAISEADLIDLLVGADPKAMRGIGELFRDARTGRKELPEDLDPGK